MDGSLKPVESDIDSLGLYGDGEAGKFNEEGSFIGQVMFFSVFALFVLSLHCTKLMRKADLVPPVGVKI